MTQKDLKPLDHRLSEPPRSDRQQTSDEWMEQLVTRAERYITMNFGVDKLIHFSYIVKFQTKGMPLATENQAYRDMVIEFHRIMTANLYLKPSTLTWSLASGWTCQEGRTP